jgi:phosphatidylglycerol:prolipoprotein diacylglycerol transferase
MKVDLVSIGKFTVHTYGLMIAIGIILCVVMGYYRAKKLELREEAVIDITIICVVAGFLGAKLLFVLIAFQQFLQDPLSVLGSSGFVVYGGIIVGVLAAFLYCKIKKLRFLTYFDLLAPSVSLAQAFGRIGCFFAGCCYGKETESAFGVIFPEGCFAPAGVRLIPTQLISSAGDFAIAILLILFSKKSRHTGDVGALYLLLYGIGRFLVELLRTNEQGGLGILTTAQLISIIFVVCALLLFVRNRKVSMTKVAIDGGR